MTFHYDRIKQWLLIGILGTILMSCEQSPRFGIVFVSDRDSNKEIYRMTSDSLNVQRLTNTPDYNEQAVAVSLDGSKILFDRDGVRLEREIYMLDVGSGSISQLTDAPAYDIPGAWSPDGNRIAFISDRDGGYYRLYLMSPDGSDQQHIPLMTDPERDVTSVAWSPNSRYIVYGTREHIHAQEILTPTLFLIDLSTLEVRRLTDEKLGDCGGGDWSPNGEWIAVVCTKGVSDNDYEEVYTIRPDGSDLKPVTSGKELGTCTSPRWSPDGEWIAMVCTKGTSAGDYGEIYIIRPDGSGLRQVTSKPTDYGPAFPKNSFRTWVGNLRWSPDGKQIVYLAAINSPWNIYIIDADGKNNRLLTSYSVVDWSLSVYRLP